MKIQLKLWGWVVVLAIVLWIVVNTARKVSVAKLLG